MCLIHYHNVSVATANLTFHWVFGNISGEIKAVVLPQSPTNEVCSFCTTWNFDFLSSV